MAIIRRVLVTGAYWVGRVIAPAVGLATAVAHALISATGGGPQAVEANLPPDSATEEEDGLV